MKQNRPGRVPVGPRVGPAYQTYDVSSDGQRVQMSDWRGPFPRASCS